MADRPLGLDPVEVLERFPNGGRLVRIASGRRRGELCLTAGGLALEVVSDHTADTTSSRGCTSSGARHRARWLLHEQLSARQLDRFERTGTFWVLTPPTWVRLGSLYDLRIRSRRSPWIERSTCVVTEHFAERPVDDLWSELLAWLAVDPVGFMKIGNPRPCRGPISAPASRGDVEAWLRTGRDRWRALRDEGLELESAHLAYEIACALDRAGRPKWAAPFAHKAWQQLVDEAGRFSDDEQHVLDAHEPLRALAARLACT